MESRLLPHPFVVSRGRIENAPLPLRPHPGPRLGLRDIVILPCDLAHHQYRAILFVVVLMFIGFVPSLKLLHAVHRRVLAVDHFGGEGAGLVTIEAATHQLIETWLVAEAPARAMHRHETPAALDIAFEVLPLLGCDLAMIRIQKHRVELTQILRVTESLLDVRHIVKVDRIPPKRFRQHWVELVAVVVLALVAEEQHTDRTFFRG